MDRMRVGPEGRRLFVEWEGFKTSVYKDVVGNPTIGVGHLLTRDELSSGKILINCRQVKYANGLTEQQCWELLDQDLGIAEDAVNACVTVPLTQNQFDVLVSFVFNAGVSAFAGSTLLKLLNNMQYDLVPAQLRRWVHSGRRIINGLVNRREKEIELWNKN